MSEQRNIFQNVVKDENSLTELLRNFLEYSLFRQMFFREVLKVEAGQLPAADEITTQRRLGNSGQPDMYICTDEVDILIEVKVNNAALTDSQPEKYLQYILNSRKKHKRLCFLLPEGYAYERDIETRSKDFCTKNQITYDQSVSFHYWSEVLLLINHYDLHEVSPLFKHFQALLRSWFEPPFITLTHSQIQRMLSSQIPTLLLQLYQTVDALYGEFSARGYVISKAKNGNEYGLYLKTAVGVQVVYVGIWYVIWQKTDSPFCLAVSRAEHSAEIVARFQQFCQEYNRQVISEGAWECIPIAKDKFYPGADVLHIVKEEVNALLKYLQPEVTQP